MYSFEGDCLAKSCIVIQKMEEYNKNKTTGLRNWAVAHLLKNGAAKKGKGGEREGVQL